MFTSVCVEIWKFKVVNTYTKTICTVYTRRISSIDLYIHNIMVYIYLGVFHAVTYYYIYVGQRNIYYS